MQSIQAIKDKLLSKFPSVHAQSWGINIRILRSVATSDGKSTAASHFILRASHFEESTFLAIERDDDYSVVSISSDDTDPFVKMLTEKFNTLWTTKALFAVANGATYDIDDVTIRLGELRSPTAPQTVRGILCSVSIAQARGSNALMTMCEDVVETLGFADAKKYTRTWTGNGRMDQVKLWCDALKQRS